MEVENSLENILWTTPFHFKNSCLEKLSLN